MLPLTKVLLPLSESLLLLWNERNIATIFMRLEIENQALCDLLLKIKNSWNFGNKGTLWMYMDFYGTYCYRLATEKGISRVRLQTVTSGNHNALYGLFVA